MAKIYDVHNIIVDPSNANFTAHTYTEVFGGSVGCTININGTVVNVGATSNVSIFVRSVSGGTGCYLLGSGNDIFAGSSDFL
jgi:hypothetical protein